MCVATPPMINDPRIRGVVDRAQVQPRTDPKLSVSTVVDPKAFEAWRSAWERLAKLPGAMGSVARKKLAELVEKERAATGTDLPAPPPGPPLFAPRIDVPRVGVGDLKIPTTPQR